MECLHNAPRHLPDWRCTKRGCGHRVCEADGTTPPRQTRELHPALWPFELISRAEARLRGRLARKGRLYR